MAMATGRDWWAAAVEQNPSREQWDAANCQEVDKDWSVFVD
jgi:hypothetical protein